MILISINFRSLSVETGAIPSDFEVACGRAGIDLIGPTESAFHIGSPESSPASDTDIAFQFPVHSSTNEQDLSPRYLSIDSKQEELMKRAAKEDLAKIFGIEVSSD